MDMGRGHEGLLSRAVELRLLKELGSIMRRILVMGSLIRDIGTGTKLLWMMSTRHHCKKCWLHSMVPSSFRYHIHNSQYPVSLNSCLKSFVMFSYLLPYNEMSLGLFQIFRDTEYCHTCLCINVQECLEW
jgi:hypothetical protein